MAIEINALTEQTLVGCTEIWNSVVQDGVAFPQENALSTQEARDFFAGQTFTAVATDDNGNVVGMYILHPNNVGRCGHICNASYAVRKDRRGEQIGEMLVRDCIKRAKEHGFGILQFNAVVSTNTAALKLYEKIGFTQLGVIPNGFRNKDGIYEDIIPHYIML